MTTLFFTMLPFVVTFAIAAWNSPDTHTEIDIARSRGCINQN